MLREIYEEVVLVLTITRTEPNFRNLKLVKSLTPNGHHKVTVSAKLDEHEVKMLEKFLNKKYPEGYFRIIIDVCDNIVMVFDDF